MYIQEIERLQKKLRPRRRKQVRGNEDRANIRTLAEAWPNDFRQRFVSAQGVAPIILQIDQVARDIVVASYGEAQASTFVDQLNALKEAIVGLRVARLGGPSAAGALASQNPDSLRLRALLEGISPALADSYTQVLNDLDDPQRISFRGTANDMREIVREVLDALAPDEEVRARPWYSNQTEDGQAKRYPTMADKARYIGEVRGLPKAGVKQATGSAGRVDDLLGGIARSTYDRGSAATHTSQAGAEIRTQLRYVDALLLELLGAGNPTRADG